MIVGEVPHKKEDVGKSALQIVYEMSTRFRLNEPDRRPRPIDEIQMPNEEERGEVNFFLDLCFKRVEDRCSCQDLLNNVLVSGYPAVASRRYKERNPAASNVVINKCPCYCC